MRVACAAPPRGGRATRRETTSPPPPAQVTSNRVLLREHRRRAVMRAPDAETVDIDDLLRDAQTTVADVGQMQQNLAMGADDLENARWRMALAAAGSLPGAASRITTSGQTNTPFFVEGVIETSALLDPHIRGKRVKTDVAQNFHVYGSQAEFESHLYRGSSRGGPEVKKSQPDALARGYFHRPTNSIHLSPDGTFSHALHEGLHKYSSLAFEAVFGTHLNEGVTQYFTRRVIDERGITGRVKSAYDNSELPCARKLLDWIGNDEGALAAAYFQGKIDRLVAEVQSRLRIDAGGLSRLGREREGRGLCAKINP